MRHIGYFLFFLVFGVGVILSPHIGPAWDEPDNIYAGGVYGNYFARGFDRKTLESEDSSASRFGDRIFSQNKAIGRYPPFPNYLGAIFARIGQIWGLEKATDIITAFHIASAFFLALLVVYVYKFALLLGLSAEVSVFAAMATYLYPVIFGHGLSTLKDISQVSMVTASLYYLVRRDFLVGAILWGLSLATKFNAIYVPIIWGLWITGKVKSQKQNKKSFIFTFFLVLLVGLLTSFLVWPYLWYDPIGRALEVVRYFTSVGTGFQIYWDGAFHTVGVGKSYWWYPWGNLIISTPLPLLLLAFIGILVAFIRRKKYLLLVLWLVVPTLRAILPNATYYDGLRHFMEVIPAVILLAGVGLTWIGSVIGEEIGTMLAGLVILTLVYTNATYFPYSAGYYNFLAQEANTRFDRDIEGLSVKEAIDWSHANYGSLSLWAPIAGHLAWYYVRPTDSYVFDAREADTVILVNKQSHNASQIREVLRTKQFRLVYTVSRDGAVFGWVYRNR